MSWVVRTFMVFGHGPEAPGDKPADDDGDDGPNIFYHFPPFGVSYFDGLFGVCAAAADLVRDFGSLDSLRTLEIGDAKLAFHHEDGVTFV